MLKLYHIQSMFTGKHSQNQNLLKEFVMSPQAKKINEDELQKINNLEKKLGKCVVAWDNKLEPADISGAELKELQNLEEQMHAVLVAYNC